MYEFAVIAMGLLLACYCCRSRWLHNRSCRRLEFFLESYNLTNHTTLYGGNSTMVSSSFGIRTSALDARQTQWGARFVF